MSELDTQKVYVIKNELGLVKIGRAEYPEERMRDLQIGCPFELKLEQTARPRNASKIEKFLHNRFRKYRLEGEWFAIPSDQLDFEIPTKISEDGTPNTDVPLTDDRDVDREWAEFFERAVDALKPQKWETKELQKLQSQWQEFLDEADAEDDESDSSDEVRSENDGMLVECPRCGHSYDMTESFCPTCGGEDINSRYGRDQWKSR